MDYWKRFFTTENDFWPQKRVWGLFQVLNTRKITPSMSSQLVDCFKKRFSHSEMIFTFPQVIKLVPKPCGGRTLLPAGRFRDAPGAACLFKRGCPFLVPPGVCAMCAYAAVHAYTWHFCPVIADFNTQNRRAHAQRRAGPCGAPLCPPKSILFAKM